MAIHEDTGAQARPIRDPNPRELIQHEQLLGQLEAIWNSPDHAPALARLKQNRWYPSFLQLWPPPDARADPLLAFKYHVDRFQWILARASCIQSDAAEAALQLSSLQERHSSAPEQADLTAAENHVRSLEQDSLCVAALLDEERKAIANASLAQRLAGYRPTLPEDHESPLQTPPGMREAWEHWAYKKPTPKYAAHRRPHRSHYDNAARRATWRKRDQGGDRPTENQLRAWATPASKA